MKKRNGDYSGNASFGYELERFKHNVTGELISLELADEVDGEILDKDYTYVTFEVDVEGNAYFTHGRYLNCSNDDAYPDEGEVNITSIIGPDKKDWEDKLSSKERDGIEEQIVESASQNDDYDCDDFEDDRECD